MKKIFNYILASGLALSAASCDFTDLEPTDKIGSNEIFSSVSTLEQTIYGAYSQLSMRTTVGVTAVLSDDVIKGGQNGGAGDNSFQWTYSEQTGDHSSLWSKFYTNIHTCNSILVGAEGIQPANAKEEQIKNNCLGTVYFMRAYSHFELLCFFSDFDNKESYGIPYSKQPILLEQLGRNSVAECFASLTEDLERAESLLANDAPDDTKSISKTAARALLSRVMLYDRNYDQAYQLASEVLAKKPIATMAEFPTIWNAQANPDVIFKLAKLPGEEKLGDTFFWNDNSSLFEPSTEIQNDFADNDIRKACFFAKGPDRDNVMVDRVIKYQGSKENIGLVDQIVLRSSEMLLIMAECKAQSGDLNTANKHLNELRAQRIKDWTTTNYDTKEEILKEILLERRRELCYEGHRFFDMRRFNLPIHKPIIGKTLEVDDFRRLMPIPLSEMQGNHVIEKQQNPGY